jgi:hypothetical protein
MKAEVEIYKGIEFVRLSSLPEEQKKLIWNSAFNKKMIKIKNGSELLTDCFPYTIYLEWYCENFSPKAEI